MSRCPEDQSALATVEVLGRSLASCPRCHGLWVEVAELEALLRASGGPAPGVFAEDGGVAAPCPNCQRPMQTGAFPGNGLQAELCPDCQRAWLAPGRLTRLLARREQQPTRKAPRARRSGKLPWRTALMTLLFFGMGWAGMAVLWPRLSSYVEEQRLQQRARQAWAVRRGPELRNDATALDNRWLRARQQYLSSDYTDAWQNLEEDDPLRDQVELSMLFNVPWPQRLVRWLQEDLLLRVVDPGLGEMPRELRVDVLAASGHELDPEWKEPDGSPREAPPAFRMVTRLDKAELTDGAKDACLEGQTRDGLMMIAFTTWEGRVVGYCFPTGKPVKLPKRGQIVTVDPDSGKTQRWNWRQGKYTHGEP